MLRYGEQGHSALTQELRQALPYGKTYSKSEIIDAYKKVYANQPEWLKAAVEYLTK